MAQITLDSLEFTYPGTDQPVIDSLDLHIEQGEAHALLGASGAGKTTLLNLLSGLLNPTGGQIRFDGKDVSQLPGRERQVAQVFQFPVLYDGMTVADNLQFAMRNRKFDRGQIQQRMDQVSAELNITHVLGKRSQELSLFEKQLVAVGKALMPPDVSVVLLDEPLTAVEPRVKWQLRQTLKAAQADLGITMIYVTHDQTEALTFADRVSVLTAQGIEQTGTPEQLYNTPATVFVGHFVGSPGMNFVPANLVSPNNQESDQAGFRPEWAQVTPATQARSLTGQVKRVRMTGDREGQPWGVMTVTTEWGDVAVQGAIDVASGDVVEVQVAHHVLYRNNQLVPAA